MARNTDGYLVPPGCAFKRKLRGVRLPKARNVAATIDARSKTVTVIYSFIYSFVYRVYLISNDDLYTYVHTNTPRLDSIGYEGIGDETRMTDRR